MANFQETYSVERGHLPRGVEVLTAFKNDFSSPVSYLFFTVCGDGETTCLRADIIDMYTPHVSRGNGAATALVRHLQTLVHVIHTVGATAGAAIVLHRCGFIHRPAEMDWYWIPSTECA